MCPVPHFSFFNITGPCLRSFHVKCLGMKNEPDEDEWFCKGCLTNKVSCPIHITHTHPPLCLTNSTTATTVRMKVTQWLGQSEAAAAVQNFHCRSLILCCYDAVEYPVGNFIMTSASKSFDKRNLLASLSKTNLVMFQNSYAR